MKKYIKIHALLLTIFIFQVLLINGCRHSKSINPMAEIPLKGEHLCISLSALSGEILSNLEEKKEISDSLRYLGGLSWLEGVVYDAKNSDIILIGKSLMDRPTYHLEDLVVNYSNVLAGQNSPYCSLDPYSENVLKLQQVMNSMKFTPGTNEDDEIQKLQKVIGDQKIIVGGVPINSRHAFVMIDADYHMKKVSQGHIKLDGVKSCLDLNSNSKNDRNLTEDITMSRYWFHIKNSDNKKYPIFVEGDDIVLISECPVVLLTEKQLPDKEGNLHDVKEKDSIGIAFAKNMTQKFSKLTSSVPIYADLENLFRLQSILKVLRFKKVTEKCDPIINRFVNNYNFSTGKIMPESLPGLVNIKHDSWSEQKGDMIANHFQTRLVAGGVGMDMKVDNVNFVNAKPIESLKSAVINSNRTKKTIFWNIYLN